MFHYSTVFTVYQTGHPGTNPPIKTLSHLSRYHKRRDRGRNALALISLTLHPSTHVIPAH